MTVEGAALPRRRNGFRLSLLNGDVKNCLPASDPRDVRFFVDLQGAINPEL